MSKGTIESWESRKHLGTESRCTLCASSMEYSLVDWKALNIQEKTQERRSNVSVLVRKSTDYWVDGADSAKYIDKAGPQPDSCY